MNIFTSFYYVIKSKMGGKVEYEVPVSEQDYGKLDDEEFVKYLHETLDNFLHNIKNNYEFQDVQTEFIVNLCVPNEEEEE
jgi:hypothetical protein